jgi:hypothetical protein
MANTNSSWLEGKMQGSFADLLSEGSPYRIEMVTRLSHEVKPPWWRFWQSPRREWVTETQSLPARMTRDGMKFHFTTETPGWELRAGEEFVEFVLWQGDAELLRQGRRVAARAGDFITPHLGFDARQIIR